MVWWVAGLQQLGLVKISADLSSPKCGGTRISTVVLPLGMSNVEIRSMLSLIVRI